MLKKLSSKGQLVLPVAYRRKMGFADGSQIRISEDGGRLTLEPARPAKQNPSKPPAARAPFFPSAQSATLPTAT